MTALTPLRHEDLLAIDKHNQQSLMSVLGLSILFGVATFLATIPGGGLWVIAGLGLALVAIVAWWMRMRSLGKRFNNYDPAKTDDELARTSNTSPEQQRLMFLQFVVLALVFGGRMFHMPGYPLISGVAVAVLSFITLITGSGGKYLPAFEPLQDMKLTGTSAITGANDWMLAFLYAHRILPGGNQWRSDSLAEAAQQFNFNEKSVKKSLSALQNKGLLAQIRELRSTDGSVVWVTLTEKGVAAAARVIKNSGS